jgi:hypothetical protein
VKVDRSSEYDDFRPYTALLVVQKYTPELPLNGAEIGDTFALCPNAVSILSSDRGLSALVLA